LCKGILTRKLKIWIKKNSLTKPIKTPARNFLTSKFPRLTNTKIISVKVVFSNTITQTLTSKEKTLVISVWMKSWKRITGSILRLGILIWLCFWSRIISLSCSSRINLICKTLSNWWRTFFSAWHLQK